MIERDKHGEEGKTDGKRPTEKIVFIKSYFSKEDIFCSTTLEDIVVKDHITDVNVTCDGT